MESFADIEKYFSTCTIAKYAYLYTVQPLLEGLPSFCLMCVGTDNKFTYTDVCRRWKFIYEQLTKRGIRIVNFASDGDSRLLKAMKINCHFSKETELSLNQRKAMETPLLQKWLAIRLPTVLSVQDMVHIAVKLKCRLLKPSIILPMGAYIASSAHLHYTSEITGKE